MSRGRRARAVGRARAAWPGEAGVPDAMRSPGRRTRCRERYATISATPKRIADVRPSWIASPLIVQPSRTSPGSSSSAVTTHGPTGQNPGIDFPISHWSPSSHSSRDETSSMIVQPNTWPIASAGVTLDAVRPITIAELALGVDVRGERPVPRKGRAVPRDRRRGLAVDERAARGRRPRCAVVQPHGVDRARVRDRRPEPYGVEADPRRRRLRIRPRLDARDRLVATRRDRAQ